MNRAVLAVACLCITNLLTFLVMAANAGEPAGAKATASLVQTREQRTSVLRAELDKLTAEQTYAFATLKVDSIELQKAIQANRNNPNTFAKSEIRRLQLTADRSRLRCDLLKIECELKSIEIERSTDR